MDYREDFIRLLPPTPLIQNAPVTSYDEVYR